MLEECWTLSDNDGRNVSTRDKWCCSWGGYLPITDPMMSRSPLYLVVGFPYYMTCSLWSAAAEEWETCAPQGTTSLARYSRLQDPEASLCQCDPQSHQLSCFRPEWWLGHWTLALDVQGLCDAASLRCCCAPYSVSLLKVKEVSCLGSLSCVLWIPMTIQTWKPLQWSWKY